MIKGLTQKIELHRNGTIMTLKKSEETSMIVRFHLLGGLNPCEAFHFIVKKDDPLYEKIDKSFLSFGGHAKFDICNGLLELNLEGEKRRKQYVITYEKWQNSEPTSTEKDPYETVLYNNTQENIALLRLFESLLEDRKRNNKPQTRPSYKRKVKENVAKQIN